MAGLKGKTWPESRPVTNEGRRTTSRPAFRTMYKCELEKTVSGVVAVLNWIREIHHQEIIKTGFNCADSVQRNGVDRA